MWKNITRNVRETFERRICSSLTDTSGQDNKSTCKFREKFLPTIHSFCERRVSDKKHNSSASDDKREEKEHERSWNDAYVRHNWLGAVGWSTAIVLSWNLLQPLCRLQFSNNYEQQQSWRKHASSSTRWGGAKGWHWKREISTSHNKQSHWPFVCPRSKQFQDTTDSVWDSGRHSFTGERNTVNVADEWDSGHHSQERGQHSVLNAESAPLLAHYESNYTGFWKLLTQTVWAQPTQILPRPANLAIDYDPTPEDTVDAKYGPPTAEQALDEAAVKLVEAQNSVMGEIDNRLGVELMQQGKPDEAVSRFTRASNFSNASAAYNLGVCYEMGLGTNKDFKQAAKYYQLASDKGHPAAMYNLGVFYVRGWGGLKNDTDEAHKLFERASALGQSEAKQALDLVKSTEAPPQLPSKTDADNSRDLVQQALGLVQDLGLGFHNVTQNECVVNSTADYKDISELVHDSILKYTSMLQK